MRDSRVSSAVGGTAESPSGPHVAVVVLHWGPEAPTMRCLASLSQDSFSGRRTVVLIDNALSLDRSIATRFPSLVIELERPAQNLGFAEGCDRGIARAMACGADFVLLLNNDAVVEPSCLDLLVKAAAETPAAGLLSPHIVTMTSPPRPWYVGGSFSLWSGVPVQARVRSGMERAGSPREVDYATGCAMLIRPAVIQRVGSLDARFFAYCEDLDFSLRARDAGFKVLVVPQARVYHEAADGDRLARSIYYSTRNLLDVIRRRGSWYHWMGILPNFLVRWLGFFTALACLRGRPDLLRALAGGMVDFARGRVGERKVGGERVPARAEKRAE